MFWKHLKKKSIEGGMEDVSIDKLILIYNKLLEFDNHQSNIQTKSHTGYSNPPRIICILILQLHEKTKRFLLLRNPLPLSPTRGFTMFLFVNSDPA